MTGASDPRAFVITEEKRPVTAVVDLREDKRPAECKAELILFHGRALTRTIEEVSRIKNLISEELEQRAVHLICSGLQGYCDNRHSLSVLG